MRFYDLNIEDFEIPLFYSTSIHSFQYLSCSFTFHHHLHDFWQSILNTLSLVKSSTVQNEAALTTELVCWHEYIVAARAVFESNVLDIIFFEPVFFVTPYRPDATFFILLDARAHTRILSSKDTAINAQSLEFEHVYSIFSISSLSGRSSGWIGEATVPNFNFRTHFGMLPHLQT